jgi:hypothetical protein
MSFLAVKDIPKSLLFSNDVIETDKTIGTLKAYAFIVQRAEQESYDMHRLVRLATRNWLRQTGALLETATSTINQIRTKFPKPEHETRDTWRIYLPHVSRALEFRDDTLDDCNTKFNASGRCSGVPCYAWTL